MLHSNMLAMCQSMVSASMWVGFSLAPLEGGKKKNPKQLARMLPALQALCKAEQVYTDT